MLVDVGRSMAATRAAATMMRHDEETTEGAEEDTADACSDDGHGRTAALEAARADARAHARDREVAVAKLNEQLARIDGMRRIANRLSDAVTNTRRHAAALQAAVDACFRDLDAACIASEKFSAAPPLPGAPLPEAPTLADDADRESSGPPPMPASPAQQVACDTCGKLCASRQGLATHVRIHKIT